MLKVTKILYNKFIKNSKQEKGVNMRLVLQRVKEGSVTIKQDVVGKIKQGYVVLVGICPTDTKEIIEAMVDKMVNLRVFSDENDKMNLSLLDIKGEVLSVSQFTLYADCRKGRRPGFTKAAKPDLAIPLYDYFNEIVKSKGIHLEQGVFGADMFVKIYNDGPVTIILDSEVDLTRTK